MKLPTAEIVLPLPEYGEALRVALVAHHKALWDAYGTILEDAKARVMADEEGDVCDFFSILQETLDDRYNDGYCYVRGEYDVDYDRGDHTYEIFTESMREKGFKVVYTGGVEFQLEFKVDVVSYEMKPSTLRMKHYPAQDLEISGGDLLVRAADYQFRFSEKGFTVRDSQKLLYEQAAYLLEQAKTNEMVQGIVQRLGLEEPTCKVTKEILLALNAEPASRLAEVLLRVL